MRSHLKVKVFTLAAEMTYIRRQEEKWKLKAKYARQKARDTSYAENAFWSHRWHRYGLKTDARNTHLAYGCMRGIPYQKMEVMCYGPLKGYGSSEPDWKSIESMIERFSKDETTPQEWMQKYSQWFFEAKFWYDNNPARIKNWQAQRKLDHEARLADTDLQDLIKQNKEIMKKQHQK